MRRLVTFAVALALGCAKGGGPEPVDASGSMRDAGPRDAMQDIDAAAKAGDAGPGDDAGGEQLVDAGHGDAGRPRTPRHVVFVSAGGGVSRGAGRVLRASFGAGPSGTTTGAGRSLVLGPGAAGR